MGCRSLRLESRFFFNDACYPQFSILDPTVLYSLPKKQIANGVIDTFVHVVEQYVTFDNKAYIQDYWAEGILKTLVEIGPKLIADQHDYDNCANFMYAATMALNGFIVMGVAQDWATHMIGQEITALHGLDHGVTLAIVYPGVISVMREDKREKLLQYGERVFGITQGSEDERIDQTIAATADFFRSLGVAIRLSDYNIGDDTIEEIANRFDARRSMLGEKGNITPDKVREILRTVK